MSYENSIKTLIKLTEVLLIQEMRNAQISFSIIMVTINIWPEN